MVNNLRRLGELVQQNTLAPTVAATTENITLSGIQTVDGVHLTQGDRVLVAEQDSAQENGIYIVRLQQWDRAPDWNQTSDIVSGVLVVVSGGVDREGIYQGFFTDPISIGSTDVRFEARSSVFIGEQQEVIEKVNVQCPPVGEPIVAGRVVTGPDNRNYVALVTTTMPASFPDPNFELDSPPLDISQLLVNVPTYAELLNVTELQGQILVGGRDTIGDGAGGVFAWSDADNTQNVTDDPLRGVYIPPTSDETGASGAWIRQYSQLHAVFFGVKADGVTDDVVACQAAIDFISLTGGELHLPSGTIAVGSGTLRIGSNAVHLIGQGQGYSGGTNLRFPTQFRRIGTGAFPMLEWGNDTDIVRGGGMRNLSFHGSNIATAVVLERATHLVFNEVLVDRVVTGWSALTSAFGNTWINCTSSNFSVCGWDLRELNHSSSLINCQTNSLSSATAISDIRIGIDGNCSEVSIIGCSFDHWGVSRQIYLYNARSVNLVSNYFEPKDANLLFSVDAGITGVIRGLNIAGNRFLGNNIGGTPVRLNDVRGASIQANEFVNYTSNRAIANSGALNTATVGSNDWQGMQKIFYSALSSGITLSDGEEVAFFGATTPVGRQDVTGSRGGNLALLSLITALDNQGLIDNQTSP